MRQQIYLAESALAALDYGLGVAYLLHPDA